MTRLPIYQVDAFTRDVFGGNPAAVCPLESWPDDATLQAIATENNLSETAFFAPEGAPGSGTYRLRWFAPRKEMSLCGHATLAIGLRPLHGTGLRRAGSALPDAQRRAAGCA